MAEPRRFVLATAAVLSAAVTMGIAALPLYLAEVDGLTHTDLLSANAVAFGAGVAMSVLATPLWGALGDRVGRRSMVVRAALGLAVSQLVLWGADSSSGIIAGRALQGLISGALPAVTAAAAGAWSGPGRTKILGDLEAAATVGAIVGPLLVALVVWVDGLSAVYATAAGLALVGGLLALGLPDSGGARASRPRWAALGAPIRRLLVLSAAIEVGQQLIELAWPVVLVSLTSDPVTQATVVAAVDVASELAYLAGAPIIARLGERCGPWPTLRACIVASAAFSTLLAWVPGPWWLVPAAAGADGSAAGIHPLVHERLADAADPAQIGAVVGLGGSALRLGGLGGAAMAPLLAGLGAAATIGIAAGWLLTVAGLVPARASAGGDQSVA